MPCRTGIVSIFSIVKCFFKAEPLLCPISARQLSLPLSFIALYFSIRLGISSERNAWLTCFAQFFFFFARLKYFSSSTPFWFYLLQHFLLRLWTLCLIFVINAIIWISCLISWLLNPTKLSIFLFEYNHLFKLEHNTK